MKKNAIKSLSLSDLMIYKEAVEMVGEYYDNLAQSHVGEYDDFSVTEKEKAEMMASKYRILNNQCFEEIKRRVDELEVG